MSLEKGPGRNRNRKDIRRGGKKNMDEAYQKYRNKTIRHPSPMLPKNCHPISLSTKQALLMCYPCLRQGITQGFINHASKGDLPFQQRLPWSWALGGNLGIVDKDRGPLNKSCFPALAGYESFGDHATSQTNVGSFLFHLQHYIFLLAKQREYTVFMTSHFLHFLHSHAGSSSLGLLRALVWNQVTNTSKSLRVFLQASCMENSSVS